MYVLIERDEVEPLTKLAEETQNSTLLKLMARHAENVTDLAAYADVIEKAREQTDDVLEIDDEPVTSDADGGVWVSAWIWVPWSDEEEETEDA